MIWWGCGVRLIIKAEVPERQNMDENMTDYQFETLLKMILEIVKGCETKEEAVNKIQELINNK